MAKSKQQYIAERTDDYELDLYSFSLIDENTVKRLRRDGEIELPARKINVPKDERWNTKQMGSKLLAGIMNGDSIPKIAQSLGEVIGNNSASAVRNARTMVTSAENHGRLDSYKNLDKQGVVQKKVWMATADDRTRASHIDIDGEEQDLDAPFTNGCMFPADGKAPAEEVWNCRCSMRTHIVGFRKADGSISPVNYERDRTIHDEQMDAEKQRRGIEEKKEPAKQVVVKERVESKVIKASMSAEDYERFMDLATDAENSELYRNYADTVSLKQRANEGSYSDFYNEIKYSFENREGISRYSTIAHEYNHLFDAKIGKDPSVTFKEIDLINEKCKLGYGDIKIIKEKVSASDQFLTALRSDMEALKAKGLQECYNEFRSTTILRNSTASVQDALDGFFGTLKTQGGWGHGDRYYNRSYNRWIKGFGKDGNLKDALNELGFDVKNQATAKTMFRQYEAASEAWANVGSAVTCGGNELKAIQQYMPNTLDAYKKIVGGLK